MRKTLCSINKVALYNTQLGAVFPLAIAGFQPCKKLLRENIHHSSMGKASRVF